jgi:protein-S-isoprenylcysteine O-methyltransferase Ste14
MEIAPPIHMIAPKPARSHSKVRFIVCLFNFPKLKSYWALVPGGLIGVLFIIRTALEDRFLQADLPGYRAYTRMVRYRLIPGIW